MRGLLVVLEGAEGVGKTTQVRYLAARIEQSGRPVTVVREPGGTPAGDEIRRVLLDAPLHITPRAEALLFMASRAQLIEELVRPALRQGAVVLTDRFFLSTYAYQVSGRGLDESSVTETNRFATGGLVPDLTVLLDLPDGEGVRRAAARGEPDRLERSGDEFHRRVSRAFREFASPDWQARHPECGPLELVSGEGTPQDVEARVWACLVRRFPETFPAARGSNRP